MNDLERQKIMILEGMEHYDFIDALKEKTMKNDRYKAYILEFKKNENEFKRWLAGFLNETLLKPYFGLNRCYPKTGVSIEKDIKLICENVWNPIFILFDSLFRKAVDLSVFPGEVISKLESIIEVVITFRETSFAYLNGKIFVKSTVPEKAISKVFTTAWTERVNALGKH